MSFKHYLNKARFKLTDTAVDVLGVSSNFDRFLAFEEKNGFPYTKAKGRASLGYTPTIEQPRSFNEKSIHRRLFSRDPLWPVATNKVLVREWLTQHHLDKGMHFVDMPYVVDDVDTFDFTQIQEPVVIKAAWASGLNIFVRSPATENWDAIRQKMLRWQAMTYFPKRLVWAETQMERSFAIEKMHSNVPGGMLDDYKLFVFHGRVELLQVISGRGKGLTYQHYDRKLNRLTHVSRKRMHDGDAPLNPTALEMIPIAERIGKSFDFARVDLYLLNGDILFGEITQCPANGFAAFTPSAFDFELGERWQYDHDRVYSGYLCYS